MRLGHSLTMKLATFRLFHVLVILACAFLDPWVKAFVLTPITLPLTAAKKQRQVSSGRDQRSETALFSALTLYGSQGSRSPLVNWAAYELGIDITMGNLVENPHPFGQIPCLVDSTHSGNDDATEGGVVVFESGAILLYLNSMLAIDDLKRKSQHQAEILSWVTWANASLDPICFLETPDGKVYDTGLKNTNNRQIRRLNQILAERRFLVDDGHSLTVADVAVASYLLYVVQFFPNIDLSHWPQMIRYMKECASRPAYAKAFGDQVQAFVLEKLENMGDQGANKKKDKILGMF